MRILAAVLSGVAGIPLGAWLNIAVLRTPMHQRLRLPGLHCGTCGSRLIDSQRLSWQAHATANNHCRICGTAVWPRVPVLEIATVALLATLGAVVGLSWSLPAYIAVFLALLAITAVDLRHYIIPTSIVYFALRLTILLFAIASLADGDLSRFGWALIGMASAWIFFFVVWFAYPAGMGFGDVRLAALVGLSCGWVGLGNVALAILLGLAMGALSGLALIVFRLKGRRDAIPFGPFMAAGAVISILAGSQIAHFMLRN